MKRILNKDRKETMMYSPKIDEDLIPILYRLAKQEKKPMTKLIDEMLRAEIERRNVQDRPQETEEVTGKVKKRVEDG
jgi:hypothetical protein